MFNLIANTMFEATRTATPASEPDRERWVRTAAGGLKTLDGKSSQAAKTGSVAKK